MKNNKVEQTPLLQEVTDEEFAEMAVKKNRKRYKKLPNHLPTKARMPYPPDEHKLIGNFESKQDLYLLFANAYNRLMKRTDHLIARNEELESRLAKLESRSKV